MCPFHKRRVGSIWSHLLPKLGQEPTRTACRCACQGQSPPLFLVLFSLKLLAIPKLAFPKKRNVCSIFDTFPPLCTTSVPVLGSFPFLTACVAPLSGGSGPDGVPNPFIPATRRCLLPDSPLQGSPSICQKLNHHPGHLFNPHNVCSLLHTHHVE